MNEVDRDLALTEALNALAVLVECLGSPLGHKAELATARGHVLNAMRAMGAVDEGDESPNHSDPVIRESRIGRDAP